MKKEMIKGFDERRLNFIQHDRSEFNILNQPNRLEEL